MTGILPEEHDQPQQPRPGQVQGRVALVTRVVCFLAADASSYITGQIWAVNGGLDM
jgi:NAD(P)-dependent dehydrogenase (short-subunit alcohol dehydrogenase family)